MNTVEAKIVLETALICAAAPLPLRELRLLFDEQVGADTIRSLLDELGRDWQGRGVELVCLAGGWRFQSRPQMRVYLDRLHPEKPPRYSRAVLETLAIIAYRQPVTRGDIEDIRGVTVTTQIVKQLEDRGWIETIGFRESPGRPALYATTRQFLDDLGLRSLGELPPLEVAGEPAPSERMEASMAGMASDALQAALELSPAGQPETEGGGPSAAAPAWPAENPVAPDASVPSSELEALPSSLEPFPSELNSPAEPPHDER